MLKDLYPNEDVNFNQEIDPAQVHMTDEEINEKYKKGEVRIITEQARYPLNTILGIVQSEDYILDPEFQRRHRWDTLKKSRLIESILMNVPIPPIFLYEKEYSVYEVMDGLQRLTAISQFYSDSFALQGLVEWPELNGKRYTELPEQIRKGIDRRYISSIILLQETAKDKEEAKRLKQLVFERINSGGAQLTPQESRNAIYPGDMNDLCIQLARNEEFCLIWNIPTPTEQELEGGELPQELVDNALFSKMEDVELVLRFFAFRQIESWDNGQLKSFFDEYLKKGNLFPAELLENLKDEFIGTTHLVYQLFGDSALWLPRERKNQGKESRWVVYESPTKVAYDTLMIVINNHLNKHEIILERKDELQKALNQLFVEESQMFKGRFNKNDIVNRINLVNNKVEEIIA